MPPAALLVFTYQTETCSLHQSMRDQILSDGGPTAFRDDMIAISESALVLPESYSCLLTGREKNVNKHLSYDGLK